MKKLFFITLFAIAFLERTVFDLGPNIELVTTAMLLTSAYLGTKRSFWLTFLIMLTTDIVIGNTNIFIFTWSGFLIPSLIVSKIFFFKNPLSSCSLLNKNFAKKYTKIKDINATIILARLLETYNNYEIKKEY